MNRSIVSRLGGEGFHLLEVAGYGDFGLFTAFVFEGDVAAVVGLAQDRENAGEVHGAFAAVVVDFGLDLAIDRLGRDLGDFGVAVALEVAGVEIDAEPRRRNGVDDA